MDPNALPFDADAMLAGLREWVECESPTYDGLYSGDWQHQKVSPHDDQPVASA